MLLLVCFSQNFLASYSHTFSWSFSVTPVPKISSENYVDNFSIQLANSLLCHASTDRSILPPKNDNICTLLNVYEKNLNKVPPGNPGKLAAEATAKGTTNPIELSPSSADLDPKSESSGIVVFTKIVVFKPTYSLFYSSNSTSSFSNYSLMIVLNHFS